jgi:hypothetical protein
MLRRAVKEAFQLEIQKNDASIRCIAPMIRPMKAFAFMKSIKGRAFLDWIEPFDLEFVVIGVARTNSSTKSGLV